MTDEEKNLEDANNQPYQPPEETPSEPGQASVWQPEPYTPPTAEPPAGMTDTTPDEALFAPPSMDASSFEGAEPAEPAPVPAMEGEVISPPPAQPGSSYSPPPVPPPGAMPVKKSGGTKWWLIILIVVLVLCCCCSVGLIAWFFGDQILQQFQGYTGLVIHLVG